MSKKLAQVQDSFMRQAQQLDIPSVGQLAFNQFINRLRHDFQDFDSNYMVKDMTVGVGKSSAPCVSIAIGKKQAPKLQARAEVYAPTAIRVDYSIESVTDSVGKRFRKYNSYMRFMHALRNAR